jgi:hypothetical protein
MRNEKWKMENESGLPPLNLPWVQDSSVHGAATVRDSVGIRGLKFKTARMLECLLELDQRKTGWKAE